MHQCSHDHGQHGHQYSHNHDSHQHDHQHSHHSHQHDHNNQNCSHNHEQQQLFDPEIHNHENKIIIDSTEDEILDNKTYNSQQALFVEEQSIEIQNNKCDDKSIKNSYLQPFQLDHLFQTSSQSENLKAIIIHLFYDVISSLIVVLSCFMVNFFQIYWFDPLSCFMVAIILLINTFPLFQRSIANIFKRQVDIETLFDSPPCFQVIKYLKKNHLQIRTIQGKILYLRINKKSNINIKDMNLEKFCEKQNFLKVVINYIQ